MSKPLSVPTGTSASTRFWTTVLACGWGLASAYILFYSLLNNGSTRLIVGALVPLVTVWAVLERKRWGRLALLGLSATALGLFLYTLGGVAASTWNLPASERSLAHIVENTLSSFGDKSEIALIVLVLALSTGYWMRRPAVVAEFEKGKRATLAVAQKAIAMSLVAFWGVTVLLVPGAPENTKKSPKTDPKNGSGQPPKAKNPSKTPKLPARSESSR